MLEKAFKGGARYWTLVGVLVLLIGAAFAAYLKQLAEGLSITGLSRDVPWGLYISQFTFMVGVAASAVVVVLPYYLHDYKLYGRVLILGEFLAIAALVVSMLFILVDMGQPARLLNLVLYPTPSSPMFWDLIALVGYLLLNTVVGFWSFDAERRGERPGRWLRGLAILSIPWAVSIHTVTAFLYAGLEARPFWLTAILAPRFLASAFASGPSLLILLALVVRRVSRFDVGDRALLSLGRVVTYAMVASLFFLGVELFTALYSGIPSHTQHLRYLYLGLGGRGNLVAPIGISSAVGVASLVWMLVPRLRRNPATLAVGCAGIVFSLWIEKGLGLVIPGFVPSPLGYTREYSPTGLEILIGLGIYAVGALVLTVLYRIVIGVREESEGLLNQGEMPVDPELGADR